jgi:hypothetical protein
MTTRRAQGVLRAGVVVLMATGQGSVQNWVVTR